MAEGRLAVTGLRFVVEETWDRQAQCNIQTAKGDLPLKSSPSILMHKVKILLPSSGYRWEMAIWTFM